MTAATQPDEDPQGQAAVITDMVNHWLAQARGDGTLEERTNYRARCRICRDPSIRELVNAMLARSFTPITIHQALEPYNREVSAKRRITYDVIWRHRRDDYNIQDPVNAVYRQLAEKHYEAEGGDLATGVGNMIRFRSFLETVMVKAYGQVIEGEVTISDGLKAVSKLAEIERKDDSLYELARMGAELNRAIVLMRKYVPMDRWEALQAEMRGEAPPQEAIEAGVPAVRMVEIRDESDEDEEYNH